MPWPFSKDSKSAGPEKSETQDAAEPAPEGEIQAESDAPSAQIGDPEAAVLDEQQEEPAPPVIEETGETSVEAEAGIPARAEKDVSATSTVGARVATDADAPGIPYKAPEHLRGDVGPSGAARARSDFRKKRKA